MVELFYTLIISGKRTIEAVPIIYRETVQKLLDERMVAEIADTVNESDVEAVEELLDERGVAE